ncbi:MAG: NADH-quinone oxidoreductase subunit G, partial [Clostridia bacterium]
MTDWITITIDGKEVQAKQGELLTEAAARAGIHIPVFCSHTKLDPLGACRMCLVEAEGRRGKALVTACTTPVSDGGTYLYNSEKAVDARQGTLELLLINQPLDCPICDKGGECPLQDQTMEHGPGKSHFWEPKRHKAKHYPLSDRIILDQERCILCWRCIRYLKEWEDKPQLGLFYRGGKTVIDKFPEGELSAYTS